jgi:uncharacterized protein involved in outer membrane biogenesis
LNSFLLALTALLILVLSALFAAPLFIDWNDYRPVFETQATKLLGRQVKVGGNVHLVLLPAPELKFDDVKVADETGNLDRPVLEARSFEAWLNFGALLSGTFEARKIAIVDPVLRLDVRGDGGSNLSDVGRRGVALPFAPKEVMLDSVSVSGGRIEITKDGSPRLSFADIVGEASAASLSGPYKVSATYSYEGRQQELRFSTSAPDAAGLFRIKSALRDPERNTTYALDGDVTGLAAKPSYDGTIIVRVANANAAPDTGTAPPDPGTAPPDAGTAPADEKQGEGTATPGEAASFLELKGPLKATLDHAELPDFDLTIHAKGRPQIMKGQLDLDFAEHLKADAALEARWVDLDVLFGAPAGDAGERPSPAEVLYLFAEEVLTDAAELGDAKLAVKLEQAGLGGDLVGDLDVALAASESGVTIDHLSATLPGKNRIEVGGKLTHGKFGPVFAGPVKLDGSDLRALSRWGSGDREVSSQASMGNFTLQANATVGDGELTLADAEGVLSDTKFRGALRLQGGERRLIELSLDSDKLDLRELLGEGPIWQTWFPTATADKDGAAPEAEPNLLVQLRDDDVRVTLHVGELLLPNIPSGRLDAGFTLISDTLDLQKLDFAAADAVALSGKGHIERLSEAPSGGVDFGLKATTTDGLRIVSQLFGLPQGVSQSKHLSALAPLDIHVGLVAAKQGEGTKASIDLAGKAGGSDVSLIARAVGDPAKLTEANIELDGSVTGDRPQALLVLLFPDLPAERLAAASGGPGKLTLELEGVPKSKLVGKVSLETAMMKLSFDGQGSAQDSGATFNGKTSLTSQDASLALMLLGVEASPSSAGIPLALHADIVKQISSIDLTAVTGTVAGQPVMGSAHFDTSGAKTRFTIGASADYVSLPSLLGVLVAWQRTPSTEEMLGAIGADASGVWPARGFSLGLLDKAEGDINVAAKTLSLGTPFQVLGATLAAKVDKQGLAITNLDGRLFGGTFAASGGLWPRGAGAELDAKAELKGGKLDEASLALLGRDLARGPFDFAFSVQGEGLSPPGLVAGLDGKGTLSLGAGALQTLSPEPLRKVALTAAKKTTKVDKEEIAAETRAVRDTLTKGLYKYPPTQFTFEVKNGTVRLAPATLSTAGAATKVNFYLELASLKIDSEWAMTLTGADHKSVPPVNLVFTGSLNKANEIAPSIDTASIEEYLTMRLMQQDVERLETLDVSGKTQAAPDTAPDSEAPPVVEPEADTTPPAETTPPPAEPAEAEPVEGPRPRAESESPNKPKLQSDPTGDTSPPSINAMRMPVPNAESEGEGVVTPASTAAPPAASSPGTAAPEAALPPEPPSAPAATPEEATPEAALPPEPLSATPAAPVDGAPADTATTSVVDQAAPAAVEVVPPARRRSVSKPRRPSGAAQEAPDSWKKGVGIFGGP